jgi:DNA-binding response OmpR family regulator
MKKILVVDDEEQIRSLLGEMLSGPKYEVVTAEDGRVAEDVLAREAIDLVVTDIVMPNENGLSLILNITQSHPEMPIIAISGGGGISGRYNYLSISELVGVKKIFKKPFPLDELRATIDSLLD